MLLYRVFPRVSGTRAGKPGHGLYVHPDQGSGRWDNPDLYLAGYFASTPEGAIGETFAGLSTWSRSMLSVPALPTATRALGVYRFDEEAHPLLDLDDPANLAARSIRPSRVVWRNRPATQAIGAAIYGEGSWSGLTWWSMHRPQWTLVCTWGMSVLTLEKVEQLPRHPALAEAATRLAKNVDDDLLP